MAHYISIRMPVELVEVVESVNWLNWWWLDVYVVVLVIVNVFGI